MDDRPPEPKKPGPGQRRTRLRNRRIRAAASPFICVSDAVSEQGGWVPARRARSCVCIRSHLRLCLGLPPLPSGRDFAIALGRRSEGAEAGGLTRREVRKRQERCGKKKGRKAVPGGSARQSRSAGSRPDGARRHPGHRRPAAAPGHVGMHGPRAERGERQTYAMPCAATSTMPPKPDMAHLRLECQQRHREATTDVCRAAAASGGREGSAGSRRAGRIAPKTTTCWRRVRQRKLGVQSTLVGKNFNVSLIFIRVDQTTFRIKYRYTVTRCPLSWSKKKC